MDRVIIIGGDLRNFHLHDLCCSHAINAQLMGFDKIDIRFPLEKRLIAEYSLIIGPIPLTLDGSSVYLPFSTTQITLVELNDTFAPNTKFITGLGGIPFESHVSELIDLTKNENFLLKNAIPTVEGIVEILFRESDRTIHASRSLILGFGRIGTRLSKTLHDLGSEITIASNNPIEETKAACDGYQHIHLSKLLYSPLDFDYIINTIPCIHLTKDVIDRIELDTLIIDIASLPGGIDNIYAKQTGHRVIIAKGIPGKSSPRTGAHYIFDTISEQISTSKC